MSSTDNRQGMCCVHQGAMHERSWLALSIWSRYSGWRRLGLVCPKCAKRILRSQGGYAAPVR